MLPPYLPLSCVVLIVCLCAPGKVPGGRVFAAELAPLKPGAPVDYAPLAFQPETWKAKGQTAMLLPWAGSNIVFLTTPGAYDGQLMAHWVRALDGGWAL